ncbi:alpha/beta hydrolase [Prauserella endophytica]|uniref:Alpha/beta fold hydrolase n=1 Tax=Prauserella endophytica TaxID=1592324 RepID=A0ABY2S3Z1_9PSEU|nr:alpha/beta fold hydrolase [Prauserella endophytica]TKG70518.1 alpha/beta fold hydrolase [Prauserella endophytica]
MAQEPTAAASGRLGRAELRVVSEPGITVRVRAVLPDIVTGRPVVLVHGARADGIAAFDLPVPGGSLAEDLAGAGHAVYVLDVRGFGASTRPAAMTGPPGDSPPLVRASEAATDIAAVAGEVAARHGTPVALLGWATGSVWAGLVAVQHPALVSHLVLHNTLYGGTDGHPTMGRGSRLDDPGRPGRFAAEAVGGYRLSTGADLLGGWDRTIPAADPDGWRDPAIAEAYVSAALAGDPTSHTRRPPSSRSPAGPLADAFLLATGGSLWNASELRCHVLASRAAHDFLSRPEDLAALVRDLRNARSVEVLELPQGTHFVHLERPERGRAAFVAAVLTLLAAP